MINALENLNRDSHADNRSNSLNIIRNFKSKTAPISSLPEGQRPSDRKRLVCHTKRIVKNIGLLGG